MKCEIFVGTPEIVKQAINKWLKNFPTLTSSGIAGLNKKRLSVKKDFVNLIPLGITNTYVQYYRGVLVVLIFYTYHFDEEKVKAR